MRVVYVTNDDVYPRLFKACKVFVDVENLFNSHLKTDEGIGEFAHVWLINELMSDFSDRMSLFLQIVDWPKYVPVGTDVEDVVLFFFSKDEYNFYGFFVVDEGDSVIDGLASKVVGKAASAALQHITD